MRTALGDAELPVVGVVLGQISHERRKDPRFIYWNEVQQGQRGLAVPHHVWVEASACPLDPDDGLHLSTAGQICLGRLMAEAYQRLAETSRKTR